MPHGLVCSGNYNTSVALQIFVESPIPGDNEYRCWCRSQNSACPLCRIQDSRLDTHTGDNCVCTLDARLHTSTTHPVIRPTHVRVHGINARGCDMHTVLYFKNSIGALCESPLGRTRRSVVVQKRSSGCRIKHGKLVDEQAKGENIETKHRTVCHLYFWYLYVKPQRECCVHVVSSRHVLQCTRSYVNFDVLPVLKHSSLRGWLHSMHDVRKRAVQAEHICCMYALSCRMLLRWRGSQHMRCEFSDGAT